MPDFCWTCGKYCDAGRRKLRSISTDMADLRTRERVEAHAVQSRGAQRLRLKGSRSATALLNPTVIGFVGFQAGRIWGAGCAGETRTCPSLTGPKIGELLKPRRADVPLEAYDAPKRL
jgi:hypothetical protein